MSSFGPFQPMMEDLRNKGRNAIDTISHPLQSLGNMIAPPQNSPHQQGIDQINQQLNMHKNDAANQSFIHPQAPQHGVLTQQAKKPR